jgi:hypothetical protein
MRRHDGHEGLDNPKGLLRVSFMQRLAPGSRDPQAAPQRVERSVLRRFVVAVFVCFVRANAFVVLNGALAWMASAPPRPKNER